MTKKPAVQNGLSAEHRRQKAHLKQLQVRLHGLRTASGTATTKRSGSSGTAQQQPLSSVEAKHEASSLEEELRDLIVEVLRSSPATAAQVNARLKAAASAADPLDAGLALVRQMQQAEGGAWTGAELGARFRLTAATLHRRRTEHRILFWRDAQEAFHYPKWQFTPAGALLPGVQDVLQTFRSADEWRLMRYFLAPRKQLTDQTPLTLLRQGKTDMVIAHARLHGQENTW